jgi:ketoreductase RED1
MDMRSEAVAAAPSRKSLARAGGAPVVVAALTCSETANGTRAAMIPSRLRFWGAVNGIESAAAPPRGPRIPRRRLIATTKGTTMDDGTGEQYRAAAVIGGGVIGASWTALFLARGLRVTVSDPRPDIERVVRAGLRAVAPTLGELGLDVAALVEDTGALMFESEVAAAVADADVVQENVSERLDLKQRVWAAVEAAAPGDALFASASSALPATAIAERMRHPERLVIGHPFNPPHLVPLVEVVPGVRTDPAVAQRAVAFYRAIGKRPQLVKKEMPGFVANRLQNALFREAVHLVREGVVTEQALDDIVTSSIGMRWAIAGPFQTFHLGGGPGGLAAFLEHFGQSFDEVGWPSLGTPSLDEATVAVLNEQAQHFGATVDQLAATRDQAIVRLLRALRQTPIQANE